MTTTVAMRASAIRAGYPGVPVLHGVSIEVAAGEMLAIVGPNGAGKSTLLKVLGGSIKPDAGSVELFGRPLDSIERREFARTVASVGQENAVAFRFTVLEIVLMGRAPHLGAFRFESPHDLAIASAALERFDLRDLAARHVQELSGGERKRVFLARALAQEPKVALLDEPTAFLDLKHVAEIFARFRELCAERGMAVVATLHDLNAAALYADRDAAARRRRRRRVRNSRRSSDRRESADAFMKPRCTSAAILRRARSSCCPPPFPSRARR